VEPAVTGQLDVRYGIDIAPYGDLADVNILGDLAAEAEDAGFDGVFIWDHIGRPPERHLAVVDTTVALAAIAMRTSRVEFGALVTPLTRRRPQKFARETATLDVMSGGRLVVGIGIGVDHSLELSGFGDTNVPREMAQRLDEAIDVVLQLWTGEEAHHHGRHFTAEGVTFTPTPARHPRPPIWVAASTAVPGAMRRAAAFEGLVPNCAVAEGARMLAAIRQRRSSLDGFDVVAMVPPDVSAQPWIDVGATWVLTAMPEQSTVANVRRAIAAGR
jgi:alkanesulfonate monooxygenase SsuD/methylene tetrahydromethanopterin reductase-like flavin-dependent oxidoreductase (luciferase family)